MSQDTYYEERREALESLDPERLRAWCARWGLGWPIDDRRLLLCAHSARAKWDLVGISEAARLESVAVVAERKAALAKKVPLAWAEDEIFYIYKKGHADAV